MQAQASEYKIYPIGLLQKEGKIPGEIQPAPGIVFGPHLQIRDNCLCMVYICNPYQDLRKDIAQSWGDESESGFAAADAPPARSLSMYGMYGTQSRRSCIVPADCTERLFLAIALMFHIGQQDFSSQRSLKKTKGHGIEGGCFGLDGSVGLDDSIISNAYSLGAAG